VMVVWSFESKLSAVACLTLSLVSIPETEHSAFIYLLLGGCHIEAVMSYCKWCRSVCRPSRNSSLTRRWTQ